jgi:hypothetical protein
MIYLPVAALLLLPIVLVAVVWNSLRRAPQRTSPLGVGLLGAALSLGVAVGLAILMAASMVIWSGGSAWDLLFHSIGILFAWFFVVIWATVAVCTFVVFFVTARFTSPQS